MALPNAEWFGRHRRGVMTIFGLLLVCAGAEGYLLYEQWAVNRTSKAQSDRLLGAFLEGDTAHVASGSSVHIRLQNVRFRWSDTVYIDADSLAVRAVPVQGRIVDFDDLESFHLTMQKSMVSVRPDVLSGMFNESVFNYPGSRVRALKVSIIKDDRGLWSVQVSGRVQVLAWLPFTMYTYLSVDPKTNTLVIGVDHIQVFGFIPATKLIHWTPLHLDRLIVVPPNRSLMVDGNRILVRPFALFPPPRIDGTIAGVAVTENAISIRFAGNPIPAPTAAAPNYVYLRGGTSQFGRFLMTDTDVLIVDQAPANSFVFSLQHYAEMLPRSTVEIRDTHSARITMPDLR